MQTIFSTNDKLILVSDEDWSYLKLNNWYVLPKGHVCRTENINGTLRTIYMTAEILDKQGIPHPFDIDHKDRNPLNNQRENLRPATRSQNRMNTGPYKNNTSGYKGVSYDKARYKFAVRISVNGVKINLGRFRDENEAAKVYDAAAKYYYGEFAVLNFPD